MRKVVIRQPKEETIFSDDLDQNQSGRYVVKLEDDPFNSFILRRIGRGTGYNDHYYIWLRLLTEHLPISTEPKNYDKSLLFRSKKEAVEDAIKKGNDNVVVFNSEIAFRQHLQGSLKNNFTLV